MFERYNIAGERDLNEAACKLESYVAERSKPTSGHALGTPQVDATEPTGENSANLLN
jgi:hypothetical protein